MNDLSLQAILETADAWPEEDRRELAEYARVIEARRRGLYKLDDLEQASIRDGLADADNGRFASDAQVAQSAKRFGA